MTTPVRPRLLFIAFYFPPTRASGVFRSRAIANHFAEAGWDVTVITPQREFFTESIKSVDESLEKEIHKDVRIERVYFPGRPWQTNLRSFSWFRGNFPTYSDRIWNRVEQKAFPERYAPWVPRVVKRARQLHKQEPYDLVLATGNPYSAFAAAWAIGKMLRIPYALDYRDSWTLDQFKECPAFPDDSPVWAWEKRLVGSAARVIFVNEAQREWHAERYPSAADNMLVVENGYDPALSGESRSEPHVDEGRGLRFGYIGTITHQIPLQEFLAGWRIARLEPELADAEVHLYGHLGFFPNQTRKMLATIPTNDGIGVTYDGAVAKADITTAYNSLDVLLMIIPSSKYVTAGKAYEYMATGKPILAIHEPWTGTRLVLDGYPMASLVDDLEPETVAAAILESARQARSVTPELTAQGQAHASRYTRAAQLAPLEQNFRELVRG
jgi:glycosyltransferase involved in cell wall biosynthesis